MKQYFLGCIMLFLTLLSACTNQQQAHAATQNEDSIKLIAVAFDAKLRSVNNSILIDVRSEEEFSKGHIKNAKNINWNGENFKVQVSTIDKSQPIFVYCLSGGRSSSAIDFLRTNGFKEVYELDGGMMKWNAANLPIVTYVSPTDVSPTESAATEDMTLEEFQKLLQTDKYVLIDFYATWCGPCKQMEPDLMDIAETMSDKVILVRIDVDKNPTISKHFEIESLPTIQIYKNQKLIWEDIGYKTKKQLVNQLK